MKNLQKILITIIVFLSILTGCTTKNKTEEVSTEYPDKFIDLHLHLDGAISIDIAKKLAEMQEMLIAEASDDYLKEKLTVPEDCNSLNDFLNCFLFPTLLLQTYEGLSEAAYLVAEDLKDQGVIYAEFRFAPQKHKLQGLSQEDAINAVLDGVRRSSLKVNVILCLMRDENNEQENYETIELAKKYLVKDDGVVALDLAGAEALYPTENYRECFKLAKEYGIPFTIHAGEADGANSVALAIEYGATRIGHGVRSYEDEEVLKQLIEKGIYLEMCPTSNRQTYAVPDMSKYPFMDYLEMGIKVTLNTDDPAIEGITIKDEYKYMEENFGLTTEQEKQILGYSVDAAFTSEIVKEALRQELGLN